MSIVTESNFPTSGDEKKIMAIRDKSYVWVNGNVLEVSDQWQEAARKIYE